MSKVFFCLALLFSVFMLFVALTGSKPMVMAFWLLIGAVSAYKLFKSPAKA